MKKAVPSRNETFAIPIGYVRPLLDELVCLGGRLDTLWQHAAVATPLEAVLNGSLSALPAAEFSRLYRASIGEIERRSCARDGRRPMGKAAMDMLCYCVIHCTTLREVIGRTAEFNAVMEERGGHITLSERGGIARFTLEVPGRGHDCAALLVDSTGLYFYYQLFSWLIGHRLPLLAVSFVHDTPDRPLPMLDAFNAPLHFEQPVNSLSFSAQCLAQPVVRSYAELSEILDYFPFNLTLGRSGQARWADDLRLLLLDSLQRRHQLPALTTVAQLLHVSPATLRRRLEQEDTSYAELRAQCQREMAENLLRQTDLPVEAIATRLGFSGDRAFRRAFREWAGTTPTAYREQGRDANAGTRSIRSSK